MNLPLNQCQTQFLLSAHLDPVLDFLPSCFREVCVVGNYPPPFGYRNYVDGIGNLPIDNKQLAELPALFFYHEQKKRGDSIGFMHYRRFFLAGDALTNVELRPASSYQESWRGQYTTNFANRTVVAEKLLQSMPITEREIIVPCKLQFSKLNLYTQFTYAHPQLDEAFLRACKIFDEIQGLEPSDSVKRFLESSNEGHFWNMFIAPYDFYLAWTNCLYSILERVKEFETLLPNLNEQNRDQHERWAGYFSERFFNYFVVIYAQENQIQITEKPVVLFVDY